MKNHQDDSDIDEDLDNLEDIDAPDDLEWDDEDLDEFLEPFDVEDLAELDKLDDIFVDDEDWKDDELETDGIEAWINESDDMEDLD
jgi:hypothetical protein